MIVCISFILLQIPIITLRMLDRYDRIWEKSVVRHSDFAEYLDLILRTLWVVFDSVIVCIYFSLIRYFVKRRSEAKRKRALVDNEIVGDKKAKGIDWMGVITIGLAIFGGLFVIEYAITSYVYTIILLTTLDDTSKETNTLYARNCNRFIIWPIFDFITAMCLLYLFYKQGLKMLKAHNKLKEGKGGNQLSFNNIDNNR